ncbi:MAG TPA: tetratricopeptide repeat protein, partial [Nitrososphaera sp.]|nr:tetratricopeptide repeat protein [Nitrososphaera sp.]
MARIGEVYWKNADYNSANTYLDEALDMQKSTVGDEHEDYANTLEDKCLVLQALGRVDEAEAGLRKTLAIRKERLGEDHPYIANSLSNIAYVLGKQRKREGTEEMYKRAIEIAEKAYGEVSPRTATFINNLGGYYLDKGNLNDAAQNFERALAIKEKCLGAESEGLIKNVNNLAIVYKKMGRIEEEQKLRERAEVLMKSRISRPDHKDVDTMIFLADKLSAEKRRAEAEEVLKRALEIAGTEYGTTSMKAGQVLNMLALVALSDKDYPTALSRSILVLRIQKKHYGKKHAEVAKILRIIGTCLMADGLMDIARLVNEQAQAIEKVSGVEDQAVAAMRKLFVQSREQKGPKDPQVLMRMKMLADTCSRHGKEEEGEALFDEYLRIKEELNPNCKDIAQELKLKAMSAIPLQVMFSETLPYVDEQDLSKATDYLKRAVRISEQHLNSEEEIEDHADLMLDLAVTLALSKQFEDSEEAAQQAIKL